jgi:hypothetical protein
VIIIHYTSTHVCITRDGKAILTIPLGEWSKALGSAKRLPEPKV